MFHRLKPFDETINLSKLDQFEGVQLNCNIPHFAFSGAGGH